MTDRTIIPRRTTPEPTGGVPETCPACRSINLQVEGDEWRCLAPGCFARSDGWMSRPSAPPDADTARAILSVVRKPQRNHADPPAAESKIGRPPATHTDAELLGYLVAYHRQHGAAPTLHNWRRDRPDGAPGHDTYYARFGGWPQALSRAGLPVNKPGTKPTSQPATAAHPEALAETAAPPPPPVSPAVTTPAGEDSKATTTEAPTLTGEVEAVLPSNYAQTPARLVASAPTRIQELPTTFAELDWRDQALERYVRALICTLENSEITDDQSITWFDGLCDRIEIAIGLLGTGENPI